MPLDDSSPSPEAPPAADAAPPPAPDAGSEPSPSAPADGAAPAAGDAAPAPQPESAAKLLKRLAELERAHRQASVREREAQERLAKLSQLDERLAKDPLALLEERGFGHDKISDALLQRMGGGAKPEPAVQALSRVEQLEKQLAAEREQAAAARQEATVAQQRAYLRDWAASQGDAYAGIASLGLESALHERVVARVQSEGLRTEPEVQAALREEAAALEQSQVDQVSRQLAALAKSPRWREILAAAVRAHDTPASQDSTPREPPPAPPTRRPATSSSTPTRTTGLSPQERTAAAAAALRGVFNQR